MKKIMLFLVLILAPCMAVAQTYPFQDRNLSDDARLDNLISLMTLQEKIDHLSPFLPGVPRLAVKGTRTVEGLHGLALSGPANWAVKGKGEALDMPSLPLTVPVRAQLVSYLTGACWEAEYHADGVIENTGTPEELARAARAAVARLRAAHAAGKE